MTMKHVISLILATLLLLLCTFPAFAEIEGHLIEGDASNKYGDVDVDVSYIWGNKLDADGASQEIDVSYNMSQYYEVYIPAEVTLKKGEEVSQELSAKRVVVDRNKALTVTVSSENYEGGWSLLGSEGQKLRYSIKSNGVEVSDNGAVFNCPGGTSAKTETIAFSLVGNPSYADMYTDTLTFTISVK